LESALSARLSVLFLFLAASVSAQPAPLVGSTVRTTSTSATSLCVGGAAGCASATGGIKAGAADVASVTSAGFIGIANSVPGDTTMRLYNNAGTLSWNGSPLSVGGSTVSGTIGKLAKFTGAAAVGDSICSESGSTITCVDTISTTTLTGTLSTVSQPNVTTMAGLVSVGTITTGVWTGTTIGLAKGGTNADLSGTGGTSQFLRQNTVGGTISVVRPAVTDLSDGSNVALLNAVNTFTAAGAHTWTAATAAGNGISIINTTSGVAAYGNLTMTAGTSNFYIDNFSQGYTTSGSAIAASTRLFADGAGGVSIAAANAAGVIRLWTGATPSLRWGVNAAGDWTFGPSAKIADSNGTPACGANCSGIDGTDYAFRFTEAGTAVVDFGHTFSTAPVCHATSENVSIGGGVHFKLYTVITSTTQATVYGNTDLAGGSAGAVSVLCRGY
jgi:hypothetical protein